MAKLGLFLVVVLFAAAGCQQKQPVSMVDNLPAPNFGGPVFQDKPVAPPPPVVVAPPRPLPAPAPQAGGVPADWIPRGPINRWVWIVVHHSATPTGGAAAFDKMHRAKGWDELGYHFVIGNGTDTRDGQVEVGSRWVKQKWGAHAKTPDNRYNEHGIGICLVGNFDITHPSEAQIRSLTRLVAFLMKTYHIAPDHVLGHRDTKSTDCPGRYVNVAQIRRMSVQMLASSGTQIPEEIDSARVSGELLHNE